jgi:23S rRNA (guanosine2251-2'-O)-methyltransferase
VRSGQQRSGQQRIGQQQRRGDGRGTEARQRAGALGGEQVEGRRAVRELLVARRRRVHELWLTDAADDSPLREEIDYLARRASVPIRRVGIGRLHGSARTDAPQGVIAFAEPLPESTLEELAVAGESGAGLAFVIVLEGVTDPHNLGAVLRVAECAGATGVVLPRHRGAHVTPAAAKAAAGAIERLPIAVVPGIPGALAELGKLGVWTVGLAPDGRDPLFGLSLATLPLALALGSEGRGLSRLSRQRCDVLARIPLAGAIESLNVSAAAAVACFEVTRQRGLAGPSGS